MLHILTLAVASGVLAEHLERIVPRGFLKRMSYEDLTHIPRHLKALSVRMDRAKHNAGKDREREAQLRPFLDRLAEFESKPELSPDAIKEVARLRFMIREFEVSLFAQEIGTAVPVSAKRLEKQIEKIVGLGG